MSNKVSILKTINQQNIYRLITQSQNNFPPDWFYKPVGIEIEITGKCNISCDGCGLRDEKEKPKDILTAKDYISILSQAKEVRMLAYSLTGGEPFLFPQRVYEMIYKSPLDLFKLNTNGFVFKDKKSTELIFQQLKIYGFDSKNKFIKPVLVISLGQQNIAGIPLENAVWAAFLFYRYFTEEKAICSFNVCDSNPELAKNIYTELKRLYKIKSGRNLDESLFPVRFFELNFLPALKRLHLESKEKITINKLIHQHREQYSSWKCLNQLPENPTEITTLVPRCLLRSNGDIYACSGFNHVHKIGNLRKENLKAIFEKANKNKLLQVIFQKGLFELFKNKQQNNKDLSDLKLSSSITPCDLCQILSK